MIFYISQRLYVRIFTRPRDSNPRAAACVVTYLAARSGAAERRRRRGGGGGGGDAAVVGPGVCVQTQRACSAMKHSSWKEAGQSSKRDQSSGR